MVTWWHSAVSLHRHHTAAFCTTHHKDVASKQVSILHGIGNILLQNSNWIIAAWASGDCLVGCCWFQYFQYHGTEYCAMFCEPGAAAADITSAAWSLRSMQMITITNALQEQGKMLGVLFLRQYHKLAVQCVVVYGVFFSFGTLVISFWMLLFPGPDVMSNGCVY